MDELASLSHAHTFADFPKNSISAWHGHDAVSDWVAEPGGGRGQHVRRLR